MNCSFKTRRSSALKTKSNTASKNTGDTSESHTHVTCCSQDGGMWWCSDTQRYTHTHNTHTNPCRMITASFDFPRGFCFNKFIVNSKMELIQTRAEQHSRGHTQPRSGSFLLVTYGTARGEVKGTEAGRLCQHGSGPLLKCCLQQARKNLQCSLFNTSFSTGSRVDGWDGDAWWTTWHTNNEMKENKGTFISRPSVFTSGLVLLRHILIFIFIKPDSKRSTRIPNNSTAA